MKWSDIPLHPAPRTLRQFAAAWLVFFLIWAAIQGWALDRPRAALVLAAVALGLGVPGCIRPTLMRWPFILSMVLVFPIGWLVSLLVLLLLYFLIFMPVALFFRLRGRDVLQRKRPPPGKVSPGPGPGDGAQSESGSGSGSGSYWQPKKTPLDVRRYFRQY